MSVRQHLYRLSAEIGSRLVGTPGNRQAREYVAGVLREVGCKVASQRFRLTISIPESGYVIPGEGGGRQECWPCLGTPALAPERVLLEDVGAGRREDWERADVTGKAALCRRGELHESVKVELAAGKGAKAVLFYVDFENCLYAARVSSRMAPVPAAVIRPSLARRLAQPAGAAIELGISAALADVECVNLWCDVGSARREECVVLCAHFDSRPFTAGANDNAAGVACLLELVRKLCGMAGKNRYRCIFFDAEEAGVAGSKAYVEAFGTAGVRSVINIDGVGFGRPKALLGDRGGPLPAAFANKARRSAARRGLAIGTAVSKTGLSDHAPFREAGIDECLWISDHPNQERETDLDVATRIDTQHLEDLVGMYVELLEGEAG